MELESLHRIIIRKFDSEEVFFKEFWRKQLNLL